MKTRTLCASLLLAANVGTAMAGGILTNTNQSVSFLRNLARDAAIGLDGVYSNPAGVAFMSDGLHLGFNWQYAHQTRTITSTNPLFALGRKNGGNDTKTYEGIADAPFVPSIQATYNMGPWSFQFNFSIPGGGGKCEFDEGLGSFESVVGNIANGLKPLGALGYDMEGYMQGRQYYFGFQLGAAYKVNDNLSLYGGMRILYGDASYKAKISNIMVNTAGGYVDFSSFMQQATATVDGGLDKVNAGIAQYEAHGMAAPAELVAQQQQLQGTLQSLNTLQKYNEGVNLLCDQTGMGFSPVLGVDYKIGDFNFAVKYDFKTPMRMKNRSTVNEASEIPAVNKFRDGEKVDEDAPALLAVGAQWQFLPGWRLGLGYHHFFDKDATWYGNTQDLLDHDTNEFLGGLEWDINDRLTASGGLQFTRYGMSDAYMNDMSFVVNSYTFGFGADYRLNDRLTLRAAYFQTNYEDYNRTNYPAAGVSDSFTRTNNVFGLGCEITL